MEYMAAARRATKRSPSPLKTGPASLSSAENGHEDSPYGTYGSWGSSYAGSWESGDVKETWLFSQLIDLADLASITVDGVTYPIK